MSLIKPQELNIGVFTYQLMSESSKAARMNPVIKYTIYLLYVPILPLLILNFIASKLVKPIKYNWSIARTITATFISLAYLKFLAPASRRRIFVRSAIPTPAQYFSSIPGEKVLNGDPQVECQHGGDHWHRVRKSVYKRDDYTCQICEIQGGNDGQDVILQADHIIPKSRGGEDDSENLRTLCRTCHQARHARLF
jgi:hypothetical protein